MLISIDKLRELVPSAVNVNDTELQAELEALESLIRGYTNNNFQNRNMRTVGTIHNGKLVFDDLYFREGDTFQISQSQYNNGLYVFGQTDRVNFYDEDSVLITKVVYPLDIIMGAVNLVRWNIDNREKVGVKSETLSRYSVTYYDLDANAVAGFPKGLMGFLKPYMKART